MSRRSNPLLSVILVAEILGPLFDDLLRPSEGVESRHRCESNKEEGQMAQFHNSTAAVP